MKIELVYALPERQHLQVIDVESGATAREVVLKSGLKELFPELDLQGIPIGIFGERVKDDHRLECGDRIELYRPLKLDPMEARRKRASGS